MAALSASKSQISLSDQLTALPGIGEKLSDALSSKGVESIQDLLLFLPRKYQDFSQVVDITKLKPGQVTIKARFSSISARRARRGLSITEAVATDETGSVRLIWFNQPFRQATLKSGVEYYISGTFKLSGRNLSIINPMTEMVSDMALNTARIIPTYSESKTLSSWVVRRAVSSALPLAKNLTDYLPGYILKSLNLLNLTAAVEQIHFPNSATELLNAKRRFQFDELFPQLLANELSQLERQKQLALKVDFNLQLAKTFVEKLPFKLTDDQRRVIWQIYQDMGAVLPMNRMVEGDVGSGKTVVAVMSALMAMAEGYKVAFMAPTELLARQHAKTIAALLKPLGWEDHLVTLTGGMKTSAKKEAIAKADSMSGALVVGTHSLLSSGVDWNKLALLIIDEQHRFGVDQRMSLQKQAHHLPHFLSITATPIPRSLALTIFNDLDISRLKQLPAGRRVITSKLIAPSEKAQFWLSLNEQLEAKRQLYVVCPYIHPNEKSEQVGAETIYEEYIKRFKNYRVGLIHGQLSAAEQTEVMEDFVKGQIDILVATTIIEVGVDVANASVMVVYGPERYGLAQLHQLRGRVGRGKYQSYCYIVLSDTLEPPMRLRQFVNLSDGFALSELDLTLRGPGAIYGKLQHGKGFLGLLTLDDHELITQVKSAVQMFIDKGEPLSKYKELKKSVEAAQQMTYLN